MGQGVLSLGGLGEAFSLACLPQQAFDGYRVSVLKKKNHVAIGKNRVQIAQNRAVHKHIPQEGKPILFCQNWRPPKNRPSKQRRETAIAWKSHKTKNEAEIKRKQEGGLLKIRKKMAPQSGG